MTDATYTEFVLNQIATTGAYHCGFDRPAARRQLLRKIVKAHGLEITECSYRRRYTVR